jgi:hypothetical protein
MDTAGGRRMIGRFLATMLPSRRAQIMDRLAGASAIAAD